MAKAKKLSTEELEQVRKAVNTANTFTAQLGQLEIQKSTTSFSSINSSGSGN